MAEEGEIVIPQPFELDGKKGTIVYFDSDDYPTNDIEKAVKARVVYDNGDRAFFFLDQGD